MKLIRKRGERAKKEVVTVAYSVADYEREQEQISILESLLNLDFVSAFVVPERELKKLEGLEGFSLLKKKEEIKKYSRIDCLALESLQQFRERDFKAFFELKTSFQRGLDSKVLYLDLQKLIDLKQAVRDYNKKCYLVYFRTDEKSKKVMRFFEGYSKEFKYFFWREQLEIFDVDSLDPENLERVQKFGKTLLILPVEKSLEITELKKELEK